jgi:predicted ATPase
MLVAWKRELAADESEYPFSVPAIRMLEPLDVHVGVTFFVGENGSGKSTLLEGIAAAAEITALGSEDVGSDFTLAPAHRLGAALRLAWSLRSRKGFFLRAEDFFGYARYRARAEAREHREKSEALGGKAPPAFETGAHPDERAAAEYFAKHDRRSHGESFMDTFEERVRPGGLYLLDEPEAPLSPKRQIAFLQLMMNAAAKGAQFIVATHSPILLACPGARIYSFDRAPAVRVTYASLEHVNVTRDFLNAPDRFLRPK